MATEKSPIQFIPIDSPQLGFSIRIVNILESNDIHLLGELLEESYWELRLLRNFGPACEREVREKLGKFGLRLKDDPKTYTLENPCPFCGHLSEPKGEEHF